LIFLILAVPYVSKETFSTFLWRFSPPPAWYFPNFSPHNPPADSPTCEFLLLSRSSPGLPQDFAPCPSTPPNVCSFFYSFFVLPFGPLGAFLAISLGTESFVTSGALPTSSGPLIAVKIFFFFAQYPNLPGQPLVLALWRGKTSSHEEQYAVADDRFCRTSPPHFLF